MNITVIFINIFASGCLIFSFLKDRKKTKQSLLGAAKSFIRILPIVFIIIIFVGLLLGFVPQTQISKIAGEYAGFWGVFLFALLGAIMHIPSLIAFPLAASFLKNGASITAVAAFITTLTMIGTITLPLEIKELGKKVALLRNGLSFIIAIVIALIMGIIL
ncbi:hypothetical protein ES708_30739 [subsurface metagenome]